MCEFWRQTKRAQLKRVNWYILVNFLFCYPVSAKMSSLNAISVTFFFFQKKGTTATYYRISYPIIPNLLANLVAEILKFHDQHLMWQLHVRQLINRLHFKANPTETIFKMKVSHFEANFWTRLVLHCFVFLDSFYCK